MQPTFRALTVAAILFATACSGSSNAIVVGPFNPASSEAVASDAESSLAGAPQPDPPYGTPFGIGGTFEPSTVPGF